MKNNKFDVNVLPCIQDFTSNSVNKIIDEIKENYKTLQEDAYKIVDFSLKNNLSGPTIYYNLIFYVEISLKYYLIVISELNIGEVERYGHDIYRLISKAKQNDASFNKLKFLLDKIKDKHNEKVDLSKYYNYKYNKEIGVLPLIFELKMNNDGKNIIKEVIKWISLHI